MSKETGSISDGYHTFDELYEHRITLFIALCRIMTGRAPVWMSAKHSDGTFFDGWFVLGLYTEKGRQITYHLPMVKWPEVEKFAQEYVTAPEFDGHTAADVLKRIGEVSR